MKSYYDNMLKFHLRFTTEKAEPAIQEVSIYLPSLIIGEYFHF